MQHLRAATQDILKRIETLSGKSVQLMRDDSLSVLATLQMARIRPANTPTQPVIELG